MEFQIQPSHDPRQPYYWRIVAANGRILAHSENYANKQDIVNIVNFVKANAATAKFLDYTRAA